MPNNPPQGRGGVGGERVQQVVGVLQQQEAVVGSESLEAFIDRLWLDQNSRKVPLVKFLRQAKGKLNPPAKAKFDSKFRNIR